MVDRVNGAPKQGFYFGSGIKVLQVTATAGDFLADLTVPGTADVVNSGLEQVLEAIATRATVIAVSVASATVVHVMVDYANAFGATDDAIGLEVEALINAIATPVDLSAAAVVVNGGFASAALGTPA
jgi:hypothetical protein